MDSKILQLIESTDPQDRKKAIQMLARMGGPEAIRYLGIIYKQESDSEVKDLAIAAGKYIKKQQTGENVAAAVPVRAAPIVEEYEEEEDEPEEPVEEVYEPVVVSGAKQSQAKGLMDRALDLSMQGDKDKALESISKAFKLNPNLRLDTYYMGVAMDISGIDHNATIRLVTEDEKSRKGKTKEKLKNDGSSGGESEEVTWDTALIDLATYFVVIIAIAIISILMSNRLVQTSPLYSDATLRAIGNLSLVMGLVFSLIGGVIAVGTLMFHYAIMHIIATAFLGGNGTYRGLIHYATTPVTVWAGITGVLSLATNYLTTMSLSSTTNARQSVQAMTDFFASPVFLIFSVVIIGLGVAFLIWFCVRVGKSYEFGLGKGCVTVIGWFASLTAISCACYFTVFTAIINALSKASPSGTGF